MSTQQLIYETAVPVSSGRHAKVSVDNGLDYSYARRVNSVPTMCVEFAQAAAEYALVFAQNGDAVLPVAILGARAGENLYVAPDGRWQATYIPAFLRRYPFVFSTEDDGKTFTLCVDEAFPGVNYLGRGQALFTADGKPTPYVENVLKFLQEYRIQFERTRAFCALVKELGLLEPMQAQFTLGSGETMSLTGFMVIDRARLKALDPAKLAELAQNDALELVYLHLYSMRNFTSVKDKLVASTPASPAVASPASAAESPASAAEASGSAASAAAGSPASAGAEVPAPAPATTAAD